jgi:phosphate transport system substrate-binding protein
MIMLRNPRLFVVVILLLFVFTGCGSRGAGDAGEGGQSSSEGSASAYIQNKGSDTIVNLALAWAERYQQEHPEMRISVTGGGSGTGIASLINGTVDIANASRQIKPEEVEEARAQGIEPQEHVIARDAIAVIVNPENPVGQLTMEQVSRIFRGRYNNWKDLGGEDRPIVRVSRETNSGTHVYFLESVIRLGEKDNKDIFSADTLLLPSSEGIISEVSDNPNAIGYDGLGYVTEDVKVVGIAGVEGGEYIYPSADTVNSGTYPISRDLYMYTDAKVSPAIQAYLDWIISAEAQEIVTELGFVPVK